MATRAGVAEYGVNSGSLGFYVAGLALNQDGWRQFSPDSLRQVYSVFSGRTDHASFDLSYTHADNQLNGQGAAPVQELAVNRSLVFTGPQTNINELNFLTLNGTFKVTDHWSLQSVLYYRQYQQSVANGNTTDFTACTDAADTLCQSDGVTPVTGQTGATLPDISLGGTVPIGENDFETINAYSRGIALQSSYDGTLVGHQNVLTAGATYDYAELNFFSGAQVGPINAQLLVEPTTLIVNTPESSEFGPSPVSLKATNRYSGLYLTDTFDITTDLSLTASARYNSASIDLQDQLGSELTGDNRFYHFNPAVGGSYKVLPTFTLYGGFSENTRTPTASEIECSDPSRPCLLPSNLAGDPPSLRQVIAHTYEVGTRGKQAFEDSSLSWNLGLFRTQVDNDIYGIATSVSSGFFQNIGATRRQGVEAGVNWRSTQWLAFFNYSFIDATFQSPLLLPSPSNPFQDADGNIQVNPGDHLPGIPRHRIKAGVDYQLLSNWTIGVTVRVLSSAIYFGDESNQNQPLPGYHVIDLHSSLQLNRHFEVFGSINNLLNTKYSTFGIYSDPSGIGAPGIPPDGVTNGPGVDNRFQSPAAPFTIVGGIRLIL